MKKVIAILALTTMFSVSFGAGARCYAQCLGLCGIDLRIATERCASDPNLIGSVEFCISIANTSYDMCDMACRGECMYM